MRLAKLTLAAAAIIICYLLCWSNNTLALYRDDLSIEEATQRMEAERAKIELNKKKIEEKQTEAVAGQKDKKEPPQQQKSSAVLKEKEQRETVNQQITPILPKKQIHSLANLSAEKLSSDISVKKNIGIILLLIAIVILLVNKRVLFSNKNKNDRN